MKNQLPRKYKIISRVCRSDAPENIVSLRYVGMHNGFADDSRRVRRSDAPENIVSSRYVGMHNGFADDSCRVRRSDAPENLVSSRYVDRPHAAFAHTVCSYTWETAKGGRPPLRHPATRMCAFQVNCHLAGSQTKKRHKLRLTCVFVMQKNKSSHIEINKKGE